MASNPSQRLERPYLNSRSPREPPGGSGSGSRSGAGSGPGSSGTWSSGITASARGAIFGGFGDEPGSAGGSTRLRRRHDRLARCARGSSASARRRRRRRRDDHRRPVGFDLVAVDHVARVAQFGQRHLPLEGVEPAAHRRHRHPAVRHEAVGGPGRIARGAQRARHPFARAAFVAAFALLDLGHQRRDALRRLRQQRLERVARHREFLRIERGARHRQRALDMARRACSASDCTRASRSRAESPERRCA